jgi:hypothetical protein
MGGWPQFHFGFELDFNRGWCATPTRSGPAVPVLLVGICDCHSSRTSVTIGRGTARRARRSLRWPHSRQSQSPKGGRALAPRGVQRSVGLASPVGRACEAGDRESAPEMGRAFASAGEAAIAGAASIVATRCFFHSRCFTRDLSALFASTGGWRIHPPLLMDAIVPACTKSL